MKEKRKKYWVRKAKKLPTCTDERTSQKVILPSTDLKILQHFQISMGGQGKSVIMALG